MLSTITPNGITVHAQIASYYCSQTPGDIPMLTSSNLLSIYCQLVGLLAAGSSNIEALHNLLPKYIGQVDWDHNPSSIGDDPEEE